MERHVPPRTIKAPWVAAVVVLGVAAPQGAQAQVPPSPELSQLQRAWSSWRENNSTRVVAEGLRIEDVNGEVTIGRVSRITCAYRACLGISLVKEIPASAFMVSPDMSRGSLLFAAYGDSVRSAWQSRGETPRIAGVRSGARVRNEATAVGTSFGRRLDVDHLKRAGLTGGSSVGFAETADPPPRTSMEFPRSSTIASNCWTPRKAERAFARRHNNERELLGLQKLRLDPELSRVARLHTREMLSKDYLFHSSTLQLRNRITGWTVLGENVGVGDSPASLMEAFMDSPLHRANVLHSTFRHVGIGTQHKNGRLWVTVIFESLLDPDTTLRMPSCN